MAADRTLLGDVGFIGAGAVGGALARAMAQCGYPVRAVASRTGASARAVAGLIAGCEAVTPATVAARCDTVFLAVPDDAIAEVAGALRWRAEQGVVHCAGALSLEPLAAAENAGAFPGALHPLQTFVRGGDPAAAASGIAYAIEAQGPLRHGLESLAVVLGGWPLTLPLEGRTLYHASAVAACGLLATLLHEAATLWDGIEGLEGRGMDALLPLAQTTLRNVARHGIPAALTGPVARGDAGVVSAHLDALAARAPNMARIYASIASASLPIAQSRGSLSDDSAGRIAHALAGALASADMHTAPKEAS